VSARLREALAWSHRRAALDNPNLSSIAVAQAAAAGVPFQQAVIAAITTLGALHGPTAQARRTIYRVPARELKAAIHEGLIIPGWGNAFYKGGDHDPAMGDLRTALEEEFPLTMAPIHWVTRALAAEGKHLAVNAAGLTAAAAEALELPEGCELGLLIEARVSAWAQIYSQAFSDSTSSLLFSP
jgi:citrate synthase